MLPTFSEFIKFSVFLGMKVVYFLKHQLSTLHAFKNSTKEPKYKTVMMKKINENIFSKNNFKNVETPNFYMFSNFSF